MPLTFATHPVLKSRQVLPGTGPSATSVRSVLPASVWRGLIHRGWRP